MGFRIYKVPKYVKIEIIKQAERIGKYKIECSIEKYTDFISREIWNVQLQTEEWFEFIPDCKVGNDWFDELYQLRKYVDKYIEEKVNNV